MRGSATLSSIPATSRSGIRHQNGMHIVRIPRLGRVQPDLRSIGRTRSTLTSRPTDRCSRDFSEVDGPSRCGVADRAYKHAGPQEVARLNLPPDPRNLYLRARRQVADAQYYTGVSNYPVRNRQRQYDAFERIDRFLPRRGPAACWSDNRARADPSLITQAFAIWVGRISRHPRESGVSDSRHGRRLTPRSTLSPDTERGKCCGHGEVAASYPIVE